MPEVRPARPDELGACIAVASRAFWPDPLLGWFARGLLPEYELAPTFFGAAIKDRLAYAELAVAEHDGRVGAVAQWVPPGELPRPGLEQARSLLRFAPVLARSRHRPTAVRLLSEVEKRHPHHPHWYLALLGTDPAAQGRGLASALVAPVLARCDEEGVDAYLETQKASNVSWYARFGFTVTAELQVGAAPKVWLLTRTPKPG